MTEDYFQETDLFSKEQNYKQLKTGFNWVLILLAFDGFISLVYFAITVSIGEDYYRKWDKDSLDTLYFVYKVLSYLFICTHVVLYILAIIKNKNTLARITLVSIGVLHLVTFVYYQFLR